MSDVSPNQVPTHPQYFILRELRASVAAGRPPAFTIYSRQAILACARRRWITGTPASARGQRITRLGGDAMARYETRYLKQSHTPAYRAAARELA